MHWFFNYIHKLQQKPKEERKRFAFLISGIITGIIFTIWLSSWLSGASATDNENKFDSTPFQSLGSALSDTYSKIKDAVGTMNDTKNTLQNQAENPAN